MSNGHIDTLGMVHDFRLIAVIITYTDEEKCLINYTYVAFAVLSFWQKGGYLQNSPVEVSDEIYSI